MEYYEQCLRQDRPATHADILTYCRTKRGFMMKSEGAQKVWVARFIKRCKKLFITPALPSSTTVQLSTEGQGCETTSPRVPTSRVKTTLLRTRVNKTQVTMTQVNTKKATTYTQTTMTRKT
ncbi:hypothetical protein PF003_g4837 [Phytophthora fragariae]|nr:hypothetical protein PF003_g4837 [Phytophthora fragariae]